MLARPEITEKVLSQVKNLIIKDRTVTVDFYQRPKKSLIFNYLNVSFLPKGQGLWCSQTCVAPVVVSFRKHRLIFNIPWSFFDNYGTPDAICLYVFEADPDKRAAAIVRDRVFRIDLAGRAALAEVVAISPSTAPADPVICLAPQNNGHRTLAKIFEFSRQ